MADRTPRNAALGYQDQGWSVFPITPGKKLPLIPWKPLQVERADAAQVHEWWTRWPTANIGVVTGPISGLLVVDIDTRHGGLESLAKLEAEHFDGPSLLTREAGTPTGGMHLYFRYPEAAELEFRNTDGGKPPSLGRGIDTRAAGGMVLAPPSRRPEGVYEWCDGPHAVTEIRPCPDWLLDLLAWIEHERGGAAIMTGVAPGPAPTLPPLDAGSYTTRMIGIIDRIQAECGTVGNRNALLYWGACRVAEMLRDGADHRYADYLLQAGLKMGLPTREVLATLRSAGVR